jgi:fumarate hydratase class II
MKRHTVHQPEQADFLVALLRQLFLVLTTALTPEIGFDKASAIAHEALGAASCRTARSACDQPVDVADGRAA